MHCHRNGSITNALSTEQPRAHVTERVADDTRWTGQEIDRKKVDERKTMLSIAASMHIL